MGLVDVHTYQENNGVKVEGKSCAQRHESRLAYIVINPNHRIAEQEEVAAADST